MKTKWYFIIAGAAVLGFAARYQDFHRRDSVRREQVAAQLAEERERAGAIEQQRQDDAIAQARAATITRHNAREAEAQRRAFEQDRREVWQSQLVAVREETAALRVNRERITREIDHVARLIAADDRERTAIASEEEFLGRYLTHARTSALRVGAVVTRVEQVRAAARVENLIGRQP